MRNKMRTVIRYRRAQQVINYWVACPPQQLPLGFADGQPQILAQSPQKYAPDSPGEG
jgi:hypothetical protein